MTDTQQDQLVFLPLGGCGEIGMNLNAYGYGPAEDRRWILIDVGVTFGGDDTPGVDLITPDPTFLEDQGDRIDAIFLTHAHEDHIGAIGLILPSALRVKPVLTPLAAVGLFVVMVLATGLHLVLGEPPVPTIVLGGLAAFVAWARFKKAPISARG